MVDCETGLLGAERDAAELAAAFKILLTDEPLRLRMTDAAVQRAADDEVAIRCSTDLSQLTIELPRRTNLFSIVWNEGFGPWLSVKDEMLSPSSPKSHKLREIGGC